MTRLIDLLLLSRCVAEDAAGEPELGRVAIAWTFLNRAREASRHMHRHGVPHPDFGDGTLREACLCRPLPPARAKFFNDPALCRALATAALTSCRDIADPTGGATHYHHHLQAPSWSHCMRPVALIGSHLFYRPFGRS